MSCPLTLTLPPRSEGKRIKVFIVPSPLMGEGEDEGETQDLKPGLVF